jgi:amino acid permease
VSSVNAAGGQSNKRLIALVLAVIGVLFVILGVIYLTVSAGSLPGFLGHINGSTGHHALRMAASFVIGVVCLVAAWFVSRGGRSGSGASPSVDASTRS